MGLLSGVEDPFRTLYLWLGPDMTPLGPDMTIEDRYGTPSGHFGYRSPTFHLIRDSKRGQAH